MKIIDFHTHIFPDFLADRAIESMKIPGKFENAIGGKASDLLGEMQNSSVSLSVNLPVLTNPLSFDSTIEHLFASNQKSNKILSFAAIHPGCDNVCDKIKKIKDYGFKGVKLHPLFQHTDISDRKNENIIYAANEQGLWVTIHAGFDINYPQGQEATVDKICKMITDVRPDKLILAHMGAEGYWEEVYDKLCGKNVYFDTAYSPDIMGEELFLKLVRAHGAKRVLFGTDSPWRSQKKYVELLNSFALTDEEKQLIFFKNAEKILGL